MAHVSLVREEKYEAGGDRYLHAGVLKQGQSCIYTHSPSHSPTKSSESSSGRPPPTRMKYGGVRAESDT